MARNKDTQVGLEFDGTTVRAAVFDTKNRRVTQTGVFTNDESLPEALAAWARSDLNQGQTLAAWTGGDTHFTTSEIPDLPDDAVAAAIRATADDQFVHAGEGIFSGGVVGSVNEVTRQRHLVVAGVEREAISTDLWKALDHNDIHLTLPGLLIRQDGVYLGIHGSNTELTVVIGELGVFSRSLQVGGVDHLVEVAKSGDRTRLNQVASEYIADLERELTSTISYAATKHDFFPSRVWVYGPGSAVPGFVAKLGAESGYEVLIPEPTIGVREIDPVHVGSHFIAIQAAATDLEANRFATIENPYRLEKHAKRAQAAKKSKRMLTMVSSVVGVAVLLGVAIFPAWKSRSDAEARKSDLLNRLVTVADADEVIQQRTAGQAAWQAATLNEVDWAALVTAIEGTAVPGMRFTNITVNRDEAGVLNVTAQGTVAGNNGFPGVATWLQSLEAIGAATIQPGGVTQSEGTTSVSVTFTVPDATPYLVARPVPGQPETTDLTAAPNDQTSTDDDAAAQPESE